MADPFVGEIKIWAFNWAPQNWLLCNGAILTIAQSPALASLLGNQFGGDGQTTFGLPDLRGRTPIGTGASPEDPNTTYVTGNLLGAETVTVSAANVPSHVHSVEAYPDNGSTPFPGGSYFATVIPPNSSTVFNVYLPGTGAVANPQVLAADTVATYGGSQGHNNMQPFTVVNFCICASGLYPPRN